MVDPMGTLIRELRAADIASDRVRGGEAGVGDERTPYQRFVVLNELSNVPLNRTPVQFARYGVRAYGTTFQDARALWGEIVEVLHIAGSRTGPTGVGIYQTRVLEAVATADPRTKQPYYDGTLEVIAGTQVLT